MVPVDDNQLPMTPPGGADSAVPAADDAAWLAAWDALPLHADATASDAARAVLGEEAAALGRLRQRLARQPLPEVAPAVRDAVLRAAEAELASDPLEGWEAARAGGNNPWQALQQRIASQPLPEVSSQVRESVLREAQAEAALRTVSDDAYLAAFDAVRHGAGSSSLPAELANEVKQLAAVQARIDTLPLPEVKPAVRAAVLGAAIESAAALQAAEEPAWKRWLSALLQPGPLAVGGLAFALAVAFAVRPDEAPAPTQAAPEGMEIASADRPVATAPVAPSAAAPEPAAAAPAPAVAAGGGALPAPAEGTAAPAPTALAKAEANAPALVPRPQRAIAANPASLGPAPAVAAVAAAADDPAPLARNAAPTGNASAGAQVAVADEQSEAPAEAYARAAGVAAALPAPPPAAKAETDDTASRDAAAAEATLAKLASLRKQAEALPVGSRGPVLDQVEKLARESGNQPYLQWVAQAKAAERAAPASKSRAPSVAPTGNKSGGSARQPSSRYGVQPPI